MRKVAADDKQVIFIVPWLQGVSDVAETGEVECADDDRDNGRHGIELYLQHGQLYLKAMLPVVRPWLMAEAAVVFDLSKYSQKLGNAKSINNALRPPNLPQLY